MLRKTIVFVFLSVFVFANADNAYSQGRNGITNRIANLLNFVNQAEPRRDGQWSAQLRGGSELIHPANPAVRFSRPVDGSTQPFGFRIEFKLANWDFRPDKATNAGSNFADGTKEPNTGHMHVWVFDYATGNQVLFLGAGSNYTRVGIDGVITGPIELPPGRYKAYVTLQNHDHTVPVQSAAPLLPAVDAVVFTIQ